MIRLLAFASLLLVTAFAVNVQAAQCDAEDDSEACQGGGYCDVEENPEAVCPQADGPEGTGYVCEGEACAYGEEDCIWCSGPIDETPSRGPEDGSCENCRTLNDEEAKDVPGFGVLIGLGAIAAAIMVARRK